MFFYHSKLNFLLVLTVLALLNICTTQHSYASVPTKNKEFPEIKKKSPSKNTSKQQKNFIISLPGKANSADLNRKKKRLVKLDAHQKPKNQQQSIVSIDNKKMLELNFGWPLKGKIVKRFSPPRNKGIDIAGKQGQPVKATEAGKVVYAGQGLIGFGKLFIIKHNIEYLSAYANNSRLLVNEGQHVKKGQVVAEVGKLGIKRPSLHFEVRKNGKPVNPLKLLPKK